MGGVDRRVGQEIRGYRIDLLVGRGGMASVYAATHVALGRRAAVKVLAPSLVAEPSYVERLLYEARIANDVRHPNIIDIFDFVELESPRTVACIMELLEGPALSDAIRDQPLRPAQAFNVTLQLADALGAVHQRGIVHRDLKPHNVMFVAPPLDDLCHVPAVKLLDFGIAKVPLGITHSLATLTGQIMGTPAYMAPEQISGAGVEPATDLYALAETLYELLTGRRPYTGTALSIMRDKLKGHPPALELPPHVPAARELRPLLEACLATLPSERPSLEDFVLALRSLGEDHGLPLGEPAAAAVRTPAPRAADATFSLVRTDPGITPFVSSLVASDHTFLDRILEDFREVIAHADGTPAAAALEASADEPPLELMRPEDRASLWPMPNPEAVIPGTPSQLEVRVGEPITPRTAATTPSAAGMRRSGSVAPATASPSKLPAVMATLAVVVVALAVALGLADHRWWAPKHPTSRDYVRARIQAWAEARGAPGEPVEVLLSRARADQRLDVHEAYARARDDLERAIVGSDGGAQPLAAYAENEVWWRAPLLGALELDELEAFVALALETAPDDAEVLRAAAVVALAHGDRPRAARHLAASLRARPLEPRTRLVRAETLLDHEPDAALATLVEPEVAELPRSRRVLAQARARLGLMATALAALDARRADLEADAALTRLYAQLLAASGERALARAALDQAAERPGADARVALERAALELADGQSAEAARALAHAGEDLGTPPTWRARALGRHARVVAAAGDLATAGRSGAEALRWDPSEREALLASAELALLGGQLGSAAAQARALAPEELGRDLEASTVAAAAHALAGQHAQAAEVVAAALQHAPGHVGLLALRGTVAWLRHDEPTLDSALGALAHADPSTLRDDDAEARGSPIALMQLAGELTASAARSQRWAEADALAGVLWAAARRPAEAHKALAAALAAKAPTPVPQIFLGHDALARGALDEARRRAQEAQAFEPIPAGAVLLSARLAEAAGEGPRADRAYAQALQLAPRLAAAEVRRAYLAWRAAPADAAAGLTHAVRAHSGLASARRVAFEAGL